MPTLNQKENELFKIIVSLYTDLKDTGIGVPLQEFYRQVKAKGIYQSDRFIAEKLRKFENIKIIQVVGWNIVKVDGRDITVSEF